MKHLNSLIPALALLAGSCFDLAAANASEQVINTYPLNADGRIRLENVNGRVSVRAWDGDGVKVEAVKEGRTPEIVAGIKIHVDATPAALTIKTGLAKVKRRWFGSAEEGRVNYTLHVPAGAQLDGIKSVNGDISVDEVRGAVRVSTVNGSIRCRGLRGSAEMDTVNGGITTAHVVLPAGGRLKARSVNGSIEVALPPGAGAELDASTVNGAVRSDQAWTETKKVKRGSVNARIGAGGARLDLGTVNGGIRIREARNEHASVP